MWVQGTESIRGLSLNLPKLTEDKRRRKNAFALLAKQYDDEDSNEKSRLPDEDNNLKRRRLSIFSWQPANTAPIRSFSTWAFEKMVRLKLLNLNYAELNGGYKEFPRSLVWLCWRGFPLKSIPIDLCLDKLVVLDMRNSKVKYLWKGIRVLHECGIFSIFLPGSRVPEWFRPKSESPSISFDIQPVPGHKIKGLSLCILYMNLGDGGYIDDNCAKINNKTKAVKWTYSPTFYGIPEVSQDMLWLSHWTFGDQLEAGDEVHVIAEMASGLHVKECGIRLIYEKKRMPQKLSKAAVLSIQRWEMQICQHMSWEQLHISVPS
ncbi:hypothetical protein GH714_033575 [Hevea brasiliensis]|uniref:C-JID domain-containing protein n=1 Tax=Hevea brasiliensis TaxID=3981 RepID=A0A6A6NE49_HEVBR|nr:hypothetical protein GH714_033575 [Hevea brasiliensis]